jgi:hypothetical protein
MSGLTRVFGGRIDIWYFALHNSSNVSPLIAQSSYNSNKVKDPQFYKIFMTFPFFIINAHIELYLNVCIAFFDIVHYKTLNTMLDI